MRYLSNVCKTRADNGRVVPIAPRMAVRAEGAGGRDGFVLETPDFIFRADAFFMGLQNHIRIIRQIYAHASHIDLPGLFLTDVPMPEHE